MSRFYDFGECLYEKSMETLYSLLHCLHQLHEECVDDSNRLADFLHKSNQWAQRTCDMCGENMTKYTIRELLTVVEQTIEKREHEMQTLRND